MCKDEWILCPICDDKARVKIRNNTVLENFPLFYSRCKKETIINIKEVKILVIKEPDAKTQNR